MLKCREKKGSRYTCANINLSDGMGSQIIVRRVFSTPRPRDARLNASRSVFQAYELSTLTGTQVMLLVASETGHVYTFATRKLQPMITSDAGKALIQTCLNSPGNEPLLL